MAWVISINRVDHRRLHQFAPVCLRSTHESVAGPILAHVSTVEHGVPVLIICGAKDAKKDSMFLRGQISRF